MKTRMLRSMRLGGIDYLKYDLCSFHNGVMRKA